MKREIKSNAREDRVKTWAMVSIVMIESGKEDYNKHIRAISSRAS